MNCLALSSIHAKLHKSHASVLHDGEGACSLSRQSRGQHGARSRRLATVVSRPCMPANASLPLGHPGISSSADSFHLLHGEGQNQLQQPSSGAQEPVWEQVASRLQGICQVAAQLVAHRSIQEDSSHLSRNLLDASVPILLDACQLHSSPKGATSASTAPHADAAAHLLALFNAVVLAPGSDPSNEWMRVWGAALAPALAYSPPITILQLMHTLHRLSDYQMEALYRVPNFWNATWSACEQCCSQVHAPPSLHLLSQPILPGRCQVVARPHANQSWEPALAQAGLLVELLKVSGKMRRAGRGLAASGPWVSVAMRHVINLMSQACEHPGSSFPEASPTTAPADSPLAHQLPSGGSNDTQLHVSVAVGNMLKNLMQALHHLRRPVPVDDATALCQLLIKSIPTMHQTHLSKLLPMLARLAQQLPVEQHLPLRASIINALLALLDPSTAPPTQGCPTSLNADNLMADVHTNSGAESEIKAVEPLFQEGPLQPPCAWELANWLYALTEGPLAVTASREAAAGQDSRARHWAQNATAVQFRRHAGLTTTQADGVAVHKLCHMLYQAASHQLLRQAGPTDFTSIVSGLAKLPIRAPDAWLPQLLHAATPRLLASLSPSQLVQTCGACAALQVGRAAQPAWINHVLRTSNSCMIDMSPALLSKLVWSMSQLSQQACQQQPPFPAKPTVVDVEQHSQGQPAAQLPEAPGVSHAAPGHVESDRGDEHGWHGMFDDPAPELPRWVHHLLQTSQAQLRHSDSVSLVTLSYGLVGLIEIGQAQIQFLAHAQQPVPHQQHTLAGWMRVMADLPSWCDEMKEAFQKRLHLADARCVANMVHAMVRLEGQPRQVPAVSVSDPRDLGRMSADRVDSDGHNPGQDRDHAMTSGSWMLACLSRVHELAYLKQCALLDLAGCLSGIANGGHSLSDDLLGQHLQLTTALASQQTASKHTAKQLSRTLAAAAVLMSRQSAAGMSGGAGQRLEALPVGRPLPQLLQEGAAVGAAVGAAMTGGVMAAEAMVTAGAAGNGASRAAKQAVEAQLQGLLLQIERHVHIAQPGTLGELWLAFGRMRRKPYPELAGAMMLACHRHMHSMEPAQLVQMAWALAVLRLTPAERWLDRWQTAVFKRFREIGLEPQTRAMAMWAGARARWPLHREFVEALIPSAKQLADWPLRDVCMITWAMSRLGLVPGSPWLMMLLMSSARDVARACNTAAGMASNGKDGGGGGGGGAASSAAEQLSSRQLGQSLLLLQQSITVWRVSAPPWWWLPWLSAMRVACSSFDLQLLSQAIRVVTLEYTALLHHGQPHPDVLAAHMDLITTLISTCNHQLQAVPKGRRPSIAALSTCVRALARCAVADAHAHVPRQCWVLNNPHVTPFMQAVFRLSVPHLKYSKPAYLLMMAGAVCVLEQHCSSSSCASPRDPAALLPQACTSPGTPRPDAQPSATGESLEDTAQVMCLIRVPRVWKDEMMRVLESHWDFLSTGERNQAQLVMERFTLGGQEASS